MSDDEQRARRADDAAAWAREPWKDEPQEQAVDPSERKDVDYSPAIERDVEALQESQDSPAFDDPDIHRDEVELLPGTGGDDDQGDIEVDPSEIHIPRHPDADAVGPVEQD